MIMIKES